MFAGGKSFRVFFNFENCVSVHGKMRFIALLAFYGTFGVIRSPYLFLICLLAHKKSPTNYLVRAFYVLTVASIVFSVSFGLNQNEDLAKNEPLNKWV